MPPGLGMPPGLTLSPVLHLCPGYMPPTCSTGEAFSGDLSTMVLLSTILQQLQYTHLTDWTLSKCLGVC